MIILNTAKELVTVDNWSDIIKRPGFTSNLDPAAHTLHAILGRYVFHERILCGLSSCHTPHAKGYVVSTTSGLETNIGQDCGKKYFGVDFETMTRKFERDVTEKEDRDKLFSFAFRVDDLRAQITELRSQDRGANWVHKQTQPLLDPAKGCPPVLVRRIAGMVKTRNPVITTQREASAQEIENMETIQGRRLTRPQYIEESLAQVAGLEALFPENDLRQLLVIELEESLRRFEEEDIDTLGYEALRRWARWIGTVEGTLETATAVVGHGRRLLTRENLEALGQVVLGDADDLARFTRYLKGL